MNELIGTIALICLVVFSCVITFFGLPYLLYMAITDPTWFFYYLDKNGGENREREEKLREITEEIFPKKGNFALVRCRFTRYGSRPDFYDQVLNFLNQSLDASMEITWTTGPSTTERKILVDIYSKNIRTLEDEISGALEIAKMSQKKPPQKSVFPTPLSRDKEYIQKEERKRTCRLCNEPICDRYECRRMGSWSTSNYVRYQGYCKYHCDHNRHDYE